MVDFLKGEIRNVPPSHFINHPTKFNFTGDVNHETGEQRDTIKTPFVKDYYKGMIIKIYESGRIVIAGSIHKLHNNGAHNYNSFHHQDMILAIDELCDYLEIEPRNIHLTQIEIGVNITPPLTTVEILGNCILHQRKELETTYVQGGKYKQARHKRLIIKIYDKKFQFEKDYKLTSEILRFEIKHIQLDTFRSKYNIYNLEDVKNNSYTIYKEELLQRWSEVMFISPLASDDKDYLKLTNVQYWKKEVFTKSNSTVKRYREKVDKLNLFAGKNLKTKIKNLISSKVNYLQKSRLGTLQDYRVCLVTGLAIDMQRQNSKLLSITGLKYYYKHQKGVFIEVATRYLSKKWIKEEFDTQIKELAHNIRNAKSNSMIRRAKFVNNGQFTLKL